MTNFEKLLMEKYKVNERPYTACFCDNFECNGCPLAGKECGRLSLTQMEEWLRAEVTEAVQISERSKS